jgi:quercetin dioxygenase-like cupin family protein
MTQTSARTLTYVALRPGEGEALWAFGGLLTFKATAEQTGGEFVLAELLLRRGMVTPLHTEDASSFYVLEGRLTFYVGDEKPIPATAGCYFHVPRGVPHAFRVESDTGRLLRLAPPLHERFFRAAGEPAPARTLPPLDDPRSQMDLEKISAAAERFGVHIIGPPPE